MRLVHTVGMAQVDVNAGIMTRKTPRMNKRIAKAKKKVNGTVPEFYKQGDFTICVVEHNGKRFVGVTKRNVRTDSPNEERAKTIAYERALKGESVRLS